MRFGNRWVPMEVMDMIFILWAIAALIILAVILWIAYFPPPSKEPQSNEAESMEPNASGRSGKRRRRRKR